MRNGVGSRLMTLLACAMATGALTAVAPSRGPVVDDPVGRPLFRIEGRVLTEASGIAVDPGNELFYMHQDAGKSPDIFVVDLTGRTRVTLRLPVPNVDWEDISLRPTQGTRGTLYIADTGDAHFITKEQNLEPRTQFAIITCDVPDVGSPGTETTLDATGVVSHPFVYADKTTHNVESLLVHPETGRITLVDKTESPTTAAYSWIGPATLSSTATNVFTRGTQVPVVGASGAAFAPGGDRFVIRNGTHAYLWHLDGGTVDEAFHRRPITIALPAQRQGEGVDFTPDGRSIVLSSEGTNALTWEVDLPAEAQTKKVDTTASAVSPDRGADRRLNQRAYVISGVTLATLVALVAWQWARRRSLQ